MPVAAIVETAGFVLAVIATPPVELPAAVGANLTTMVALWPTGTLTGMAMLFMEKPVPTTDTCEIASAAVPVLVTTRFFVGALPTATFPNTTSPGLREIVVFAGGGGSFGA